jgi:hypothetical protein
MQLFFCVLLYFSCIYAAPSVFCAILCCLGYCLPAFLWTDLKVETFVTNVFSSSTKLTWFLATISVQQPLNSDGCLYHMELLIKPSYLCIPSSCG